MKVLYELTAKVGEYQKDGETKSRYQRIGTMFERDDGNKTIKLDCVPVGAPEWTGWVNLFEPRIKGNDFNTAKQAVKDVQDDGMDSSEIPF